MERLTYDGREIPYFPREVISPEQNPARWGVLSYADSIRAIERSAITPGQRSFLGALLKKGGAKQFPGGLGLDYDYVFKKLFYPQESWTAIEEMAAKFAGKVAVVLMPERSAVIPGVQFSEALGRIPVIRMEKNGGWRETDFAFQVDSYTGGGRDTISVERQVVEAVVRERAGDKPVNLLLVDEIIDTGGMAMGVGGNEGFVGQCCRVGLPVRLVGVAALMEKSYTGAAVKLRQELGIEVVSAVKIEDIWLNFSDYGSGIKVAGIEQGLSFKSLVE